MDIRDFLKVISKKYPNFNGKEQNDSEEFFIIFLNEINKDFNKVINIPEYKEYIYNDNKTFEENNILFNEFFLQYENSIITDIFYLQMASVFICECNYKVQYKIKNIHI